MLKALVPGVAAIIFIVLAGFGITEEMTVGEAVNTALMGLVGSLGVWLVPNKQKPKV